MTSSSVLLLVGRRDSGATRRRELIAELAELPREEVDLIAHSLGYVPRPANESARVSR